MLLFKAVASMDFGLKQVAMSILLHPSDCREAHSKCFLFDGHWSMRFHRNLYENLQRRSYMDAS